MRGWLTKVGLVFLMVLVVPVAAYEGFSEAPELIRGNNEFSFDFYRAVAKGEQGNLVMSPFNLSTCLSMVYLGAKEHTAQQMRQVLHYPVQQPPALAQEFASILGNLTAAEESPVQLYLTNGLWVADTMHLLPAYRWMIETHYGSTIDKVNFERPKEVAADINAWVAASTRDMIQRLVTERDLNRDTKLVLASALYMKAPWAHPFRKGHTRKAPFFLASGDSVDAQLMHQTQPFPIVETDTYQMIVLPYKKGQEATRLGMVVVLPKAIDGLSQVEKEFTYDEFSKQLLSTERKPVALTLPKFGYKTRLTPKVTLESMGMVQVFSRWADLSGIAGMRNLFIDKVIHAAVIDVDEAGTEAAAVTGAIVGATAAPAPQKPVLFQADHPFLYLITDLHSGQILFIGRVLNPTEE